MDNVCSKCGNTIPEGASFCTECGTPISETSKTKKKLIDIVKKNKKAEEIKDDIIVSPVHGSVAPNKDSEPIEDQDKVDVAFVSDKETPAKKTPISENVFREKPVEKISKPLKAGFFFFLIVLYKIPVIGLITAAIVSSSAKNDNIANYSKATFVWKIVLLVLLFIGFIVLLIFVKKADLSMIEYIKAIKSAVLAFVPKQAA